MLVGLPDVIAQTLVAATEDGIAAFKAHREAVRRSAIVIGNAGVENAGAASSTTQADGNAVVIVASRTRMSEEERQANIAKFEADLAARRAAEGLTWESAAPEAVGPELNLDPVDAGIVVASSPNGELSPLVLGVGYQPEMGLMQFVATNYLNVTPGTKGAFDTRLLEENSKNLWRLEDIANVVDGWSQSDPTFAPFARNIRAAVNSDMAIFEADWSQQGRDFARKYLEVASYVNVYAAAVQTGVDLHQGNISVDQAAMNLLPGRVGKAARLANSDRRPPFEKQRLDPRFAGERPLEARTYQLTQGADGRWYTVDSRGNRFTAKGRYNFVTIDGQVRVSPTRNGHYSISGGAEAVDYAGSVQFGRGASRGQLVSFTNDSGHYKPNPAAAWQSGLPVEKFQQW